MPRKLLSRVVFYAHELSGILLHDSVDEFLSFEKADDLLVSVQSPPSLLRVNAEFEHHCEASSPGPTSLGSSVSQANGRER